MDITFHTTTVSAGNLKVPQCAHSVLNVPTSVVPRVNYLLLVVLKYNVADNEAL